MKLTASFAEKSTAARKLEELINQLPCKSAASPSDDETEYDPELAVTMARIEKTRQFSRIASRPSGRLSGKLIGL